MKMKMLSAITILTSTVITTTLANDATPDASSCVSQTAPAAQLIDRAEAIVIATAIEETPSGEDIDLRSVQQEANKSQPGDQIKAGRLPVQLFSVSEYLKGDGPETLPLVFAAAADDAPLNAIPHSNDLFWSDPVAGRTVLSKGCIVETRFSPGVTYLLFVGPAHVKAYEAITDDEDDWLAFVRENVSKF